MTLNSGNPASQGGTIPPDRTEAADGAPHPEMASGAEANPSWVSARVPADPDAPADVAVQVTPDGLKAFLSILPPAQQSAKTLEAGYIVSQWKAHGLDADHLGSELVDRLAGEWNRSRQAIESVLAAEAEHAPVPGEDARIEYLVDPSLKLGPVEEGGNVDFKSLNLIKPVKQGQPLARRHPPGKGAPGIDLFGRPAQAPDGNDVALPAGPNTEVSAGDANLLVASVSGFLQKKDGLLSVDQCFIVDGSVDYSTGNIAYEQSAVIRGDIADGFTVTVGGALEVGGSVGEAKLMVGGDILIKKGFVGSGHGMVTSKGDVSIGFASNQTVRAHGNLTLVKESFNCHLASRKGISVLGPLVGGIAMAGGEIVCRQAGNELGTKTELEAGMDYILHENRALLEEKIKELTSHLGKITQKLARFREAYRVRKRFTSAEAKLMLELRDMQEKIQVRLPAMEKRKADLLEQIRKGCLKEGIFIRVEKKVNPGVIIRMGSESLRIQEEMSGPKVFAYKLGRIKVL
jgi:uncharacterized protein (DUF342 family)